MHVYKVRQHFTQNFYFGKIEEIYHQNSVTESSSDTKKEYGNFVLLTAIEVGTWSKHHWSSNIEIITSAKSCRCDHEKPEGGKKRKKQPYVPASELRRTS